MVAADGATAAAGGQIGRKGGVVNFCDGSGCSKKYEKFQHLMASLFYLFLSLWRELEALTSFP